ncbi:MAG TPA: DNA gyrase/topoisomerase IV subunit A [Candidatus Deferrimicrobium sp.]|nr:DNA gyrase/topoisomerase IV subunit A [Candidatus Deferrimicrobium sp.]
MSNNNNHHNHNKNLIDLPGEDSHGVPAADELTTEELHHIKNLPGMYKSWFLEYASYVILERAVPDIYDGLKPVQRRILHAMKRLDDGRYNKVANIIGFTMQYHPHGDASIGDALVAMGQKDLMIDTQGNWGNIYTGDGAAAPRYIEARLSKFALDVAFNPKTTEWKLSYDGRNKEPVHLPVKFPLLLAQGAEGIAVGLASKILPHNFSELIDACIAHLKGETFELLPDFPTGGMADCSKYNDGLQGGKVRVRARISRLDKKTLVITEIPFGKNTTSLIDTILAAAEKGKIKIKKIDDNTAENVEILVHLAPGVSPDQTIDGLYAFTDCEISISTNCCVIQEGKPRFLGVSEMLKISAANTVNLLKRELEIRREELAEEWHKSSLEKIFIEKKIYNHIEKCVTWESVIETIDKGLDPYKHLLQRQVTHDDIVGLTELKIKRISRYDAFKADEHIKSIEAELKEVGHHLAHLIEYAVAYYQNIKDKYAAGKERKTQVRNFDVIEATKVVAVNEKLYVNRKEGFVGMSLKKDEFVAECSDIDDIIVFLKDGRYLVTKVADKIFVGLDIIHVGIFKKNDERTIYNVIYQDGKIGSAMIKRFAVTGVTRDKEYHVGKGTPDSRVLYLTANPNGEAEIVRVNLKPQPRLRKPQFEIDFSTIAIKGRGSMGNILSRRPVSKIVLKEDGISTLGGRNIWFDMDVSRLNADGRGLYLGEFSGDDKIVAITKSGNFRLHGFDLTTHFEADVLMVEKFDPEKIYTAVYFDGEQGYYYLKRFNAEPTEKLISFIGEHPESRLVAISGDDLPRLMIKYKSTRKKNVEEILDGAEFIAVKGCKARGRRISTTPIESIELLEPVIKEEELIEVEIEEEIPPLLQVQGMEEEPLEIQKSLFDIPVPKN